MQAECFPELMAKMRGSDIYAPVLIYPGDSNFFPLLHTSEKQDRFAHSLTWLPWLEKRADLTPMTREDCG